MTFRTEEDAKNADTVMSTQEAMKKQGKNGFICGKEYILRTLSKKGE